MPWGIAANYADEGKFFEATAPWPVPGEKTGPAPLAPIGPMVEQAERHWGSAAGSVRILNPGDRSAQVIVSSAPDAGMSISLRSLTFRSEEHTSELQSLMRISYAVFCLKKKNKNTYTR